MRIMGLDFGSKTVGVAVSDPLGLTAQSLEIVRRKSENKLRQTYARIEELAAQYEVEKSAAGLPRSRVHLQMRFSAGPGSRWSCGTRDSQL